MPNIVLEIPDVENSVSRPVVVEVIRQLTEIMGLDSHKMRVLHPGDIEESYQQGSTLSESGSLEGRTSLPFGEQMSIQVTEDTFRDSMILTHARKTDNIPTFLDDKLQVLIRPVKSPVEITLNIEYRAESKSKAQAWKNRMETKLYTYGEINLHTATYQYMMPLWFMDILREIHTLRETVAPYGEDFSEYLAGHINSQATTITSLDGGAVNLTIAETQIRIQGLYDFVVAPEKAEKSDNGSVWTTTFTYKFMYDKPIGMNMLYPVIVHNQVIDSRYIRIDDAPNLDNHRKSFSLSGNALHYFERPNEIYLYKDVRKVVTVPVFDEYRPNVELHATSTLFTALMQVDQANPKVLFNINDIGDYEIDPDVLEFIKDSEWRWLTVPYKTMFNISLYVNSCLAESQRITCDQDLNVSSINDLDPRNIHQVRFSIVNDIDTIDHEALRRMKKYPKALVKIILAMGTSMGQLKLLSQRVDLTKYLKDYLPDTGYPINFIQKHRIQHNTVQSHFVVVEKRPENVDPMHTLIGNGYAHR